MRNIVVCLFLAVLSLMALVGNSQSSGYSKEMFRVAIADLKKSRNYILVSIQQSETGSRHEVCLPAPELMHALEAQAGVADDEAGQKQVRETALAARDRTFVISKPSAIQSVEPRYSAEMLQEMRDLMASRTEEQLHNAALVNEIWLRAAARDHRFDLVDGYRDAAAHVLLEHGIACAVEDGTGRLSVLPVARYI